jgi:hypothetical protein
LLGIVLLATSLCGQAAVPQTSRDVARAQETLGWRPGIAAWSFPDRTFFEVIELTASLGQKHIEGFSGQTVSTDLPKSLNHSLSEGERRAVVAKLRSAGMTMPTYDVGRMPLDEDSCSRVFEFAPGFRRGNDRV